MHCFSEYSDMQEKVDMAIKWQISDNQFYRDLIFLKDFLRAGENAEINRTLYVSNLGYDVREEELKLHFCEVVPVIKVTIFYDRSGYSTGTGEIVFRSVEDATSALVSFKNMTFKGRYMKIKSILKRDIDNGYQTLIIGNLKPEDTAAELRAHFRPPFRVKKVSIIYDECGRKTGRGIVVFDSYLYNKGINRAIENQLYCFKGRELMVSILGCICCPEGLTFLHRHSTICMFNLDNNVTATDLEHYFSTVSEVKKAVIYYNKDGTSTGTAEIEFEETSNISSILRFVSKTCDQRISTVWCLNKFDDSNFGKEDEAEQTNLREKYGEEGTWKNYFEESDDFEKNEGSDDFEKNEGSSELFGAEPTKLKHFHSKKENKKKKVVVTPSERDCGIYITNLHTEVTASELKAHFGTRLPVKEACILLGDDGSSTGTGLVIFKSRRERLTGTLLFDDKEFRGRQMKLHCIPGGMAACWGQ